MQGSPPEANNIMFATVVLRYLSLVSTLPTLLVELKDAEEKKIQFRDVVLEIFISTMATRTDKASNGDVHHCLARHLSRI